MPRRKPRCACSWDMRSATAQQQDRKEQYQYVCIQRTTQLVEKNKKTAARHLARGLSRYLRILCISYRKGRRHLRAHTSGFVSSSTVSWVTSDGRSAQLSIVIVVWAFTSTPVIRQNTTAKPEGAITLLWCLCLAEGFVYFARGIWMGFA